MGRTILYIVFSLMLFNTINAQALAVKKHSIDWINVLSLSKEQQHKINQLEKTFRNKSRVLYQSKESCVNQEAFTAEAQTLREQFFVEMQQILTPEQRDQANQIIRSQHQKMQLRYAESLAQELSMTAEQKLTFIEVINLMNFQYQWPINILQRQQSQQELESHMQSLLTDEQKELWEKKQSSASHKNWHHYQEHDERCLKALAND